MIDPLLSRGRILSKLDDLQLRGWLVRPVFLLCHEDDASVWTGLNSDCLFAGIFKKNCGVSEVKVLPFFTTNLKKLKFPIYPSLSAADVPSR